MEGLEFPESFVEGVTEPSIESTVPDHRISSPEEEIIFGNSIMAGDALIASEVWVADNRLLVSVVPSRVAVEGIVVPVVSANTLVNQLETPSLVSQQTGFSQPIVQPLAPMLVIHDISFKLRRTVQESLESLVTLLDTFKDIRFLSPDRATAIELKSTDEICSFVALAWKEFSKAEMEAKARLDALGFQLPPEAYTRDLADLIRCGSLAALIRERQVAAAPDRFNIERVNRCFTHCCPEDLARLRDIAINGTRFMLPEGFVSQLQPNPMRNIYQRLGMCFEKHAYRLWSQGRVLLLPLAEIARYGSAYNLSSDAWWVGDAGKPAGRILIDPSNPKGEGWALNTPEVKADAEARYGILSLPTIKEIVSSLLAYAKKNDYAVADMRFFKLDISNAFGCLPVNPELAAYMMIRIGDMTMTHINNQFGPTVVPCTYGVLSRATNHEIGLLMDGPCFVYVDDYMGFGHKDRLWEEFERVMAFLLDALGREALSPKTVKPTDRGEVLGWYLCLFCLLQKCATIRPNDKGIRKLALVFLSIDLEAVYWSLHLCQVLASLAERYSQGIMGMRPFVEPLTSLLRGSWSDIRRDTMRKVSSMAKLAVVMWRAIIILMLSSPELLAVPLEVFVKDPLAIAEFSFITDAADWVGLVIYEGESVLMYTSYRLPFNAHDSAYQNTREFLGIVLTLVVAKRHFSLPRGSRFAWKSDSMSALSWVEKNKSSSELAHKAFVAYSWIMILTGYEVVHSTHIAGASEEMADIDRLSRNRLPLHLDPSASLDTTSQGDLNELFQLLSPVGLNDCTLADHTVVLHAVMRAVAKALGAN